MSRPKKFSDLDVIERAMDYFWTNGYASSSLNDLARVLNLGKASLYHRFGSKQHLFKKVVEHYGETVVQKNLCILEAAPTGRSALESLFTDLAARAVLPEQFRGCLLINSMSELGLETQERAWVSQCLEKMRSGLLKALARGVEDRSLPSHLEVEQASFSVLCTMQGIRLLSRHGVPTEQLLGCAQNCIKGLLDQGSDV